MAHYFTNDYVSSNPKQIKVKINNHDYTFKVDNGVFSKSGLDYGTRTLLESLPLDKVQGDVLDFGCGYGPIGIFIAKETKSQVDMVDINERSLRLAYENSEINNVKTNIFKSDVYEKVTKKYDYIITNPPIRVGKKILYQILFEANNHLKSGGEMWLVVNKNQGAKSLYKDLSETYQTEVITKNKGFYIISAKKY